MHVSTALRTRNPNNREQPAAALVPPKLKNYGGRTLKQPHIVSLYYGSYWGSAAGKTDRNYLDRFGKALVQSKYMSIWKEYGVGKGRFDGSATLTPLRNPTKVTEQGVQRVIQQAFDSGALKRGTPQTVYTVFLPPNAELVSDGVSSKDGMGGYHSSFKDRQGNTIYYAAIVYSKGENGIDFTGKPEDNMSITASHEWSEAVTDPDVNHGTLGWYDQRYGEVGDIPINIGIPLESVYGRIGRYAVQKEWSNRDQKAELASKES